MTKLVKIKVTPGGDWWTLFPNLIFQDTLRKKSRHNNVQATELLMLFAGHVTHKENSLSDKELYRIRKKIKFDLDTRIEALKYTVKLVQKEYKFLLKLSKSKYRRTYHPYQRLIIAVVTYLDAVYSLRDFIKSIDGSLSRVELSSDLEETEWFYIYHDLRNIFSHNETPIVSFKGHILTLLFEDLPRKPLIIHTYPKEPSGLYRIQFTPGGLGNDVLQYVSEWSKKHLSCIDSNAETTIFSTLDKNGNVTFSTIALKDIVPF